MHIIDLSGPIRHGMWTYGPPIPPVRVEQVASIPIHGYDAHSFTLATIVGTYLESGAHLIPGAATIDTIPVERFVLEAALLRLAPKAARQPITAEELAAAGAAVRPGDAILVATGWDSRWDEPNYVQDSPHFTPEAMDWVIAQRPALLGLDVPCSEDPHQPIDLNSGLFRTGALLLAPLVNLGQVPAVRFRLVALPLRIVGVCGTPCRAIALVEGSGMSAQ